jgi:hypothetical protein
MTENFHAESVEQAIDILKWNCTTFGKYFEVADCVSLGSNVFKMIYKVFRSWDTLFESFKNKPIDVQNDCWLATNEILGFYIDYYKKNRGLLKPQAAKWQDRETRYLEFQKNCTLNTYRDTNNVIYLTSPIKGNKKSVLVERDPTTTATTIWSHLQQKHIQIEVCNLKPFSMTHAQIANLVERKSWELVDCSRLQIVTVSPPKQTVPNDQIISRSLPTGNKPAQLF